jgi:hypothetical protein
MKEFHLALRSRTTAASRLAHRRVWCARPRVEDIAAFRVPGDRLIKLHVATWHAGPHFVHDECFFVNLENLDTNHRDFHAVPLPVECRYGL